VTIAGYYARYAVAGRAVLEGPPEHPLRWIVADGRDFYLCERTTVRLVAGGDPVPRSGRPGWWVRQSAQKTCRRPRRGVGHSLGA
jgi:hypothetical protein